ncbi:MAG TPA: bis(5'-nucleosyl)-tetraphosphatase (symmetrical) YqeK [Clostridia bacterium]|nr:bis(5'-nucleosyl)-tetraphosphatase (symmetrical) YqeK [Clostridia bacterium]
MIKPEDIARQKLTARRFEHTLRVADSARELAQKYGANDRKAKIAAMLHDIMKDTPHQEQLAMIEKSGTVLCDVDRRSPNIWHSMAGAIYVREELGIDDTDIYNAVHYHTTGRAGMSKLEKVIYVADYISADRVYKGVEEMRRLAGESLDDAMLFALEFCITKLAKARELIHPNGVACYNELLIEKQTKLDFNK